MRLLLDTHALIWWLTNNSRLSATATQAIADPINWILVSSASGYEIAYKQQRGRLQQPLPYPLATVIHRAGFAPLEITVDHAEAAGHLPGPHRDPWDRLLIAQALSGGLIVVTVDPVFASYGVPILW